MVRKIFIVPLLALLPVLLLSGCDSKMVVFDPKGPAAREILGLINWSLVFMALVVVVVFGLFGYIVWKYRATPENKDYEPPEEHGSTKLELIWTFIPILIVIALTIPTVSTIYKLEKVPAGYENKKPITINVTSADWKWIFSYPEQGIETVNYVNIPVGTPVKFKLTSAGTMQSFWVPQLGGQKYTMNKMETELYLTADEVGEYLGRNTNFNGKGYADMEFTVEAKNTKDFEKWVNEVKDTAPKLTEKKYYELLNPTHLGRETYVGTHLQWVDHSQMNSKTFTNPKLYEVHGVKGQIFKDEEPSTETSKDSTNTTDKSNGGEH
ncbi:cytochrome ubiquinol oxidase subunit II [Bacillus sp. AFS076308]|uniref:cytochrome aa3 quinol oxidase subunit II n=1 Tax=unclassified Bacillus (in: firmicutes) TaxID=185979 RepID=UPI000BF3CDF0|nr:MULTISPECIES: cytochrome aa3 quinol oxidase subunit II [unclassified Bacillus (in: firmicutes)]PFN97782.1 cytochrome ubiquinol oxidase subunit II [Bacillus sp. AFS076308]PGV51118.1 cytochrome ubiquinol oxidase subunit II [Bacillus sp. AFS037270]